MKKTLVTLGLMMGLGIFTLQAQETKTKPVTTPADKVHNVIHPTHKVAHGTKYKHKTATGKKQTVTVKKPNAEAIKPKEKTKKDQ